MIEPSPRSLVFRLSELSMRLASVRYRGLIPACALVDSGHAVSCISAGDGLPAMADLVFVIKPLTVKEAHFAGVAISKGFPVVVDLCDNIFIDNYAGQGSVIPDRFSGLAERASLVTVPTAALAEVVARTGGVPASKIIVVPDAVENRELLNKQARLIGLEPRGLARIRNRLAAPFASLPRLLRRITSGGTKRILWFGNHGASYANFGLSDIELFRGALEAAARRQPVELWVVSNSEKKYRQMVGGMALPSRYFEWSESIIDQLLDVVDLTIVPNSLDEFSRTKSANRALKSLASGVPVVATPTDAYQELQEAIWTADPQEGIEACLSDPDLVALQMAAARKSIDAHFSLPALGKHMAQVVGRGVLQ